MKLLKKILLLLVVLVAIVLIAALFVSKDVLYEKSISINAPIESVWENVNSLDDMDKWSPWNDIDPNMKKDMKGPDGQIGAVASWDSDHEEVGKGSQTIAKIEAPTLFETDLKFYEPYESEAKGYVKLEKEDAGTKVTWGFKSEIPYPFNIMMLFSDMEESMGETWNNGLAKLEKLSLETHKKELELKEQEKQRQLELEQQEQEEQG